jgi:AcrR family transcriptional regulator
VSLFGHKYATIWLYRTIVTRDLLVIVVGPTQKNYQTSVSVVRVTPWPAHLQRHTRKVDTKLFLNMFKIFLDAELFKVQYLNMFNIVAPTERGELTRNTILASALQLFRDKGFEATTMRDVANRAGVALGSAYYYFDSKDAIVMGFYERAQEHLAPLLDVSLADSKHLDDRLRAIIQIKFDYFAADRKLMGALSSHIDPHHPLSPFSKETRSIREQDIGFFSRAIEGGKLRVPEDLKAHLPQVLWLYQMALILFWLYDSSPKQERTIKLFDKSLAIVVALIKLSSFTLLRPVRKLVTELLEIAYDTVHAEESQAKEKPQRRIRHSWRSTAR